MKNGEHMNCLKAVSSESFLDYYPLEKNSLTVRFLINTEAMQKEETTDCLCQTKINYDNTCFKWVIKDFNLSNFTSSREFFYSEDEFQFKIRIKVRDSDDHIKIYIDKLSSEMEKFNVLRCRLSLLTQDGNVGIYEQGIHWYDVHNRVWNFPSFLKKSSLNNYKLKDTTNFAINLLCDFSVPREDVLSQIHYGTIDYIMDKPRNNYIKSFNILDASSKIYLARLPSGDDVRNFFDNYTSGYVTLQIGEDFFKGHKITLSTGSPVFRALFQPGASGSQTGVVEIQDMESKTLKDFLKLAYSGSVDDLSVDRALNLLLAADKYQVGSLKEKCCSFLIPALNVKNVCKVLLLAERISEESLKTAAIAFIKKNASEIIASREWLNCVKKNSELTTEITSQIIAHLKADK